MSRKKTAFRKTKACIDCARELASRGMRGLYLPAEPGEVVCSYHAGKRRIQRCIDAVKARQ